MTPLTRVLAIRKLILAQAADGDSTKLNIGMPPVTKESNETSRVRGRIRGGRPTRLQRRCLWRVGWQQVLAGVAAALQVIVMVLTLVSGCCGRVGLGLVANVVAILGLVLVLVVGSRTGRSSAVIALLAVPVVSGRLIAGLAAFDIRQVHGPRVATASWRRWPDLSRPAASR